MKKKLLSVLIILVLITATGCIKPPVRWRYDPGIKSTNKPQMSALILPVVDERVAKNESPSLLRFLPLVPYTVEEDDVFDQILLQNGSRFGAQRNPEIGFHLREDLHEAVKEQFAYSGIYGPVFGNRTEVGEWSRDPKPHHVVSITVNELTFQKKQLRYGLGPLAFIAHGFGAPDYRLQLRGDILLEIKDDSGTFDERKSIPLKKTFHNGWYQNLAAEQRALDALGIELQRELDVMIHQEK